MSVWFKSRLNPWYIWIPSNPNLNSTKIIMKMRWQTIASNVSIRTISPTATPLPKAYDCVAVYIAGRRTSLVVYGWWPQPPTKNWIQQVLVGLLSSFPINYTCYHYTAVGKYCTLCVQMLDGANWHEAPWKLCLFTFWLWSGHCSQLALISTAMIQIYILGARLMSFEKIKHISVSYLE